MQTATRTARATVNSSHAGALAEAVSCEEVLSGHWDKLALGGVRQYDV